MCYALDDDALYVAADAKPKRRPARALRRLENLRANPRFALVVDEWDEDWRRLAWVLVQGPASEIVDPHRHAEALARLRARYPQYQQMQIDDPHDHPIVRLEAVRVRLWRADAMSPA